MRIGILTSGGDAPGMNATIRAVVRGGLYYGMEIFGIRQGYEGLINGEFVQMGTASVADIIHRGGTILQTARSAAFMTDEGLKRGYEQLQKHKIDALVVIGGDGTLTGGERLHSVTGMRVFGLPGTIDNDLAYTDFTIGFDTSVNTVLSAIGNIRDTSSSHGRTTIVEVMGRQCGDIALHAGLAGGAETILVPEKSYDLDDIVKKLQAGRDRGKRHSIIIKAEGVDISSEKLAETLTERMEGAEVKVVILGYIQRGGSPTARDRILASRTGVRCVELIKEGVSNAAVGIKGDTVVDYPLAVALAMEKDSHLEYQRICDILL
ncbi:MAG: 6-phosphofructokinase [Clostridia bacterium]|nr:6-phosphofructokinase [Clostridia bacterium]